MNIPDLLTTAPLMRYLKFAAAALALAGAGVAGYQIGYDRSQSGIAQERAEEVQRLKGEIAALKATTEADRAAAAVRAAETAKIAQSYETTRSALAALQRKYKELTKNETAKPEYSCPLPDTGVDVLRRYIDDLNGVHDRPD